MISDAELLRRYTDEKSEPAFTELVQRHLNFVYSCALRRVGNPQLAKDVTQQVFVAVAHNSAALMKRAVLGGWLFTTARNVSVQIVRREERRKTRETEAQIMNELTSTPSHDAAWQRLNPVLDEGMDELTDADREAVILRFFAGKSFREIGSKFSLSENAARMRVERALERMRSVLKRRGVTSTTAALALALASQASIAAPAGLAATITGAVLALATGGGSAAGFFGIFISMNTLKIVTGTAVVLLAAGAIVSTVREPSRSSNPVAESAPQPPGVLEPKSDGVTVAIPASVPSDQPGKSTSPVIAKIAPATVVPQPDENNAARQARRDARQEERREAKTEANRAVKQEATEANRAVRLRETTVRRLTPLFQQLSLTPEQQEKLVVLVMDQHESTLDSAAAYARQGIDISEDMDAYWTGKILLGEKFATGVNALLGENGYQAFLANDLRVAQEAVVEHLQKRLTPGGAQLSEAQADQLLTLLRERNTHRVEDDVLQQASGFLSAPQMDSLKFESRRQTEGPLKPAVQKVIDRNLGGKTTPAKK